MRRTLRSLAASMLASVSLSGCWLQVGYDAAHTRHNAVETTLTPAAAETLTEAWSADLLAKAGEPLVRGDRVFVVSGGPEGSSTATQAKAFAVTDGTEAWEREFYGAGEALFWQPSFVGDELWTGYFMISYVVYRPYGAYAGPVRLRASDGTVVASSQSYAGLTAPVDTGDRVVQGGISISPLQRQLVVRDKASGSTLWASNFPFESTNLPGPPPAVADGEIFFGDGTNLYRYPLAGCGAAECTPTWTFALGATPTAVVAPPGGSTVFVTRGNDLLAVDRATGAVAWTAPLGAAAPGLAVVGDNLYVGAGTTLAMYPAGGCGEATCQPTTSVTLPTAVTAAPVAAAGVVYVGKVGAIAMFDTELGRVGALEVPGSPSSLAVAGGRLFVVTAPGGALPSKLVAFAPRPD